MFVTGLYAGIGGFELALSQAGFHAGLLVEIDPAAREVLAQHFPGAEVRADVMQLQDIPAATSLLTAGFPCQNLSMAGDKSGITGSKSGTVSRLFELIQRSRVPLVLIENVYFMLQLDRGRGMRYLVSEFERLGYRWAYRVLDTLGFGLPQRRRRVYFLASLDLDPRRVLFADEDDTMQAASVDLSTPVGFYWTEGRSGVGLTADAIPPLKVGSAVGIPSAPAVLFPDGNVLMPDVESCELLQGFPRSWTSAAAKDGRGDRLRWRMVGNAVSVPVARWVADRLANPRCVLDFEMHDLNPSVRWPNAAWNVGAGRKSVTAGARPVRVPKLSISTFRDRFWSRLSAKALDGFITRAMEGGLRMPPGFLDALRNAERKNGNGFARLANASFGA